MIKQIKLSPDGMVCLSTGSDCTLKVWDIGTRKCIKSFGSESLMQKKFSTYHKDSINALEVGFDSDIVFTGGRDGSIFKTDLIENQ